MGRAVSLSFYAAILAVSAAQLLGGEQAINDLTDPGVEAAANASVKQLNSFRSSDLPELILYRIVSGTMQVVNGINYHLNIELADALTCLNDNVPSALIECPVDVSTVRLWRAEVFESSGSPVVYSVGNITLVEDPNVGGGGTKMVIQNFTDPRVLGAACAAADQITEMSNSINKIVVVSVLNGTYQVVNGLRYYLIIDVALSTTCNRNSPECYVSKCPIDDRTRMLWMISVVASATPQPTYTVLSVSQIHNGPPPGGKMIIQNFTDPRVRGAACAAANQITEMSHSANKQVVVSILNGTQQVVDGIRYELWIEVASSITCERSSPECFSDKCPVNDRTQILWTASVVASPTPQPTYTVLSVGQVPTIGDSGTGGAATVVSHLLAIIAMLAMSFVM